MKISDVFQFISHTSLAKEVELLPFEIPPSYLEIIENFNVKDIKEKKFKVFTDKTRSDFAYLNSFFSISEILDLYQQYYYDFPDDEIIKRKLLFIGDTSAPISICIGIGINNYGQIFLFGWDLGIVEIAENLKLFFDSLELDEKEG